MLINYQAMNTLFVTIG